MSKVLTIISCLKILRDGELFLNYLQAVLGSFPDFFIDYSPIAAHRDHVSESLERV